MHNSTHCIIDICNVLNQLYSAKNIWCEIGLRWFCFINAFKTNLVALKLVSSYLLFRTVGSCTCCSGKQIYKLQTKSFNSNIYSPKKGLKDFWIRQYTMGRVANLIGLQKLKVVLSTSRNSSLMYPLRCGYLAYYFASSIRSLLVDSAMMFHQKFLWFLIVL